MRPWDGITAEDVRIRRKRDISFRVGPRRTITVSGGGPTVQAEIGPIDYPDSYSSPAAFIRNQRTAMRDPAAPGDASKIEWFCFTCSFRPWADTGRAESAYVTVVRRNGSTQRLRARERSGRWTVARRLLPGESAYVAAGDVTDAFGNVNGADSAAVQGQP